VVRLCWWGGMTCGSGVPQHVLWGCGGPVGRYVPPGRPGSPHPQSLPRGGKRVLRHAGLPFCVCYCCWSLRGVLS